MKEIHESVFLFKTRQLKWLRVLLLLLLVFRLLAVFADSRGLFTDFILTCSKVQQVLWLQNSLLKICYRLNVFPPNSMLKPNLQWMVLGGGAFETWLDHEGRAIMNGISALRNKFLELFLLPCSFYHIKLWQEDSNLWTRNQTSPDNKSASILAWTSQTPKRSETNFCCLSTT